jgi:hypothetical protein
MSVSEQSELAILTAGIKNLEDVANSSLERNDTAGGLRYVNSEYFTQAMVAQVRERLAKLPPEEGKPLIARFDAVVGAISVKVNMFVAALEKFENLGSGQKN